MNDSWLEYYDVPFSNDPHFQTSTLTQINNLVTYGGIKHVVNIIIAMQDVADSTN